MKLWLKRFEDNELWIFEDHPGVFPDSREWLIEHGIHCFPIDENLFSEITFENSPQIVEVKIN